MEPPEPAEGEDAPAPEDSEVQLPAHPKWEGLSYASDASLPIARPDVVFPPALPELPERVKLAAFTAAAGLVPPV